MALPIKDVIATYNSNGDNFGIIGEVKLLAGVFTMPTADEPIKFVADDGIVVPSRTTTERDAIADPQDGAILQDSTEDRVNAYFRDRWNPFLTAVIKTITTTPFAVTNEDILLVDPGVPASDIEINLPASGDRHDATHDTCQVITIRNIHDSNVDRVNINPDGSEEINEVTTIQLKRGESVTLAPDGSDWWSIGS